MVKLSATAFADEEAAPDCLDVSKIYRCITVPMPSECQTHIRLLLEPVKEPHQGWVAGFHVERSYDCEPFDSIYVETPDFDATEEDTYADLGSAVVSAAERVSWWLVTNTGDSDNDPMGCQADTALGDWKQELDPETITESCFDEATDEEVNQAADAKEPLFVQVGNTITTPAMLAEAKENLDAEHEKVKQDLAWGIARGHMDLARAKANVKRLNKQIESAVARLEEMEEDGPEELPLFDQVEQVTMENETANTPAVAELWRTLNLKDLTGLTPKIVEILDLEGIRTLGDWVDFPARRGMEYTQIKNAAGGITEARFEKISAALMTATTGK